MSNEIQNIEQTEGNSNETNNTNQSSEITAKEAITFAIIVAICCAVACYIFKGWNIWKFGEKYGSEEAGVQLKWINAVVACIIMWCSSFKHMNYWCLKIRKNRLHIITTIITAFLLSCIYGFVFSFIAFFVIVILMQIYVVILMILVIAKGLFLE